MSGMYAADANLQRLRGVCLFWGFVFFAYTLGSMCQALKVSLSPRQSLCGGHTVQPSSWRLRARGAGRPVIDHCPLPN